MPCQYTYIQWVAHTGNMWRSAVLLQYVKQFYVLLFCVVVFYIILIHVISLNETICLVYHNFVSVPEPYQYLYSNQDYVKFLAKQ